MGTSKVAPAPPTRKWNAVVSQLASPYRDSEFIVNTTLSIAVGCLASSMPMNAPIIYGAYEGFKFIKNVNEVGIEEATEIAALDLVETYFIPSVSDSLWGLALDNIEPELIETPFGRLAETAFKKTLNQIMFMGANALMEDE